MALNMIIYVHMPIKNSSYLKALYSSFTKPPKEELLEYYHHADLFLFPSFLDTQGLVLAEAMACGTPVLAIHGQANKISFRMVTMAFLVEDRHEMAQKIMDISHDQRLHSQLQQGAFETSKKNIIHRL